MTGFLRTPACVALIAIASLLLPACEPDGKAPSQNAGTPKSNGGEQFDFYVLALSWSPSYCATAGDKADRQQCRSGSGYSFIVHGLWPQYEKGFPENCPTDQPKSVPQTLARRYEDITPSGGLIRHEWAKHGTCTGLTQAQYLETTRAARERIAVPMEFASPSIDRNISPAAVEDAFVKANKGLRHDGIAVMCDRRFLSGVRICMTHALEFRPCEQVDKEGCHLKSLSMPAPR